jgi:hypothetical protein
MLPFHIHIIHYSLPITHSCALYSVRTRSKSKSILSDVHYFRPAIPFRGATAAAARQGPITRSGEVGRQ